MWSGCRTTPRSSWTSRMAACRPVSSGSNLPPGKMNASVRYLRSTATWPSSLVRTTAATLMDGLGCTVAHSAVYDDHDKHHGGSDEGKQDVESETLPDGLQRAVFGLVGPQGAQGTEHDTREDQQRGRVVVFQQPLHGLHDEHRPNGQTRHENAAIADVTGRYGTQGGFI